MIFDEWMGGRRMVAPWRWPLRLLAVLFINLGRFGEWLWDRA